MTVTKKSFRDNTLGYFLIKKPEKESKTHFVAMPKAAKHFYSLVYNKLESFGYGRLNLSSLIFVSEDDTRHSCYTSKRLGQSGYL
jgi:hypothetical protein